MSGQRGAEPLFRPISRHSISIRFEIPVVSLHTSRYIENSSYDIRKKHKYVVGFLSKYDNTERVPRWRGSTPSSVLARSEPVPGVDDPRRSHPPRRSDAPLSPASDPPRRPRGQRYRRVKRIIASDLDRPRGRGLLSCDGPDAAPTRDTLGRAATMPLPHRLSALPPYTRMLLTSA